MKLMSLGIMSTLNNDLDFDTAFLVASEYGVTANRKQEIKEEDVKEIAYKLCLEENPNFDNLEEWRKDFSRGGSGFSWWLCRVGSS